MKQHAEFPNLYVVDHPLVQHKLSLMRDKSCPMGTFRALLKEISLLMGYELTANLPVKTQRIETPLTEMDAPFLAGPEPVIVPILRAGLAMSDGLQDLMPMAAIGHVGLYRDEVTHEPVEYLVRLPKPEGRFFIVVDPMLATGHSARHATDVLVRRGVDVSRIRFMALVSSPEGVRAYHSAYPQVPVFTAALDSHLNEKAYIVPGLGDAGDRVFGTT